MSQKARYFWMGYIAGVFMAMFFLTAIAIFMGV
jgi:hypothetical protein